MMYLISGGMLADSDIGPLSIESLFPWRLRGDFLAEAARDKTFYVKANAYNFTPNAINDILDPLVLTLKSEVRSPYVP